MFTLIFVDMGWNFERSYDLFEPATIKIFLDITRISKVWVIAITSVGPCEKIEMKISQGRFNKQYQINYERFNLPNNSKQGKKRFSENWKSIIISPNKSRSNS